jgi:hypothetical protein
MLRTASSLPPKGLSTLGSGPARFQTTPPACYRASWQLPGPDFHRQATTSLRTRRHTMALGHGVTSGSAGRTRSLQCRKWISFRMPLTVFLASGGTETELTTSGTTLGLRIDGKGRCVVVSPPRCRSCRRNASSRQPQVLARRDACPEQRRVARPTWPLSVPTGTDGVSARKIRALRCIRTSVTVLRQDIGDSYASRLW